MTCICSKMRLRRGPAQQNARDSRLASSQEAAMKQLVAVGVMALVLALVLRSQYRDCGQGGGWRLTTLCAVSVTSATSAANLPVGRAGLDDEGSELGDTCGPHR